MSSPFNIDNQIPITRKRNSICREYSSHFSDRIGSVGQFYHRGAAASAFACVCACQATGGRHSSLYFRENARNPIPTRPTRNFGYRHRAATAFPESNPVFSRQTKRIWIMCSLLSTDAAKLDELERPSEAKPRDWHAMWYGSGVILSHLLQSSRTSRTTPSGGFARPTSDLACQ